MGLRLDSECIGHLKAEEAGAAFVRTHGAGGAGNPAWRTAQPGHGSQEPLGQGRFHGCRRIAGCHAGRDSLRPRRAHEEHAALQRGKGRSNSRDAGRVRRQDTGRVRAAAKAGEEGSLCRRSWWEKAPYSPREARVPGMARVHMRSGFGPVARRKSSRVGPPRGRWMRARLPHDDRPRRRVRRLIHGATGSTAPDFVSQPAAGGLVGAGRGHSAGRGRAGGDACPGLTAGAHNAACCAVSRPLVHCAHDLGPRAVRGARERVGPETSRSPPFLPPFLPPRTATHKHRAPCSTWGLCSHRVVRRCPGRRLLCGICLLPPPPCARSSGHAGRGTVGDTTSLVRG